MTYVLSSSQINLLYAYCCIFRTYPFGYTKPFFLSSPEIYATFPSPPSPFYLYYLMLSHSHRSVLLSSLHQPFYYIAISLNKRVPRARFSSRKTMNSPPGAERRSRGRMDVVVVEMSEPLFSSSSSSSLPVPYTVYFRPPAPPGLLQAAVVMDGAIAHSTLYFRERERQGRRTMAIHHDLSWSLHLS